MKIRIKDFGPISEIEFDLNKDIHLVYGKNAIGKSYAVYCVYSLLKIFREDTLYRKPFRVREDDEKLSNKLIQIANDSISSRKDISEMISKHYGEWFNNNCSELFANSLQNTFQSLNSISNRLSGKQYNIELILDDPKISIQIKEDANHHPIFSVSGLEHRVLLQKTASSTYTVYLDNDSEFVSASEENFVTMLSNYLRTFLFDIVKCINRITGDLFFLPASRSGLYQGLNAFTPILAELTQNRFYLKSKSIELPALSEPVSDYFLDISTVNTKNINHELKEVVESLEEILGGKVKYDDTTKKIYFLPKKIGLELDLSEASSMVAELSPIVLFIKYILNYKHTTRDSFGRNLVEAERKQGLRKEVLFIEEPEAHLHPEVQVKLMEIFAKLPDYNIKIFITSHSNYMFNKINNLLLSEELDEDKVAVYHLVESEVGSKVNAGMNVTEEGIADENFAGVSEQLYEERLDILEKANHDQ